MVTVKFSHRKLKHPHCFVLDDSKLFQIAIFWSIGLFLPVFQMTRPKTHGGTSKKNSEPFSNQGSLTVFWELRRRRVKFSTRVVGKHHVIYHVTKCIQYMSTYVSISIYFHLYIFPAHCIYICFIVKLFHDYNCMIILYIYVYVLFIYICICRTCPFFLSPPSEQNPAFKPEIWEAIASVRHDIGLSEHFQMPMPCTVDAIQKARLVGSWLVSW